MTDRAQTRITRRRFATTIGGALDREFDGRHALPPEIATGAFTWMIS